MRISDWSSDVCSSDLEIAAASASWSDDAAATLFAAGIAARFAAPGLSALWALTRFDLYAPGLEQAGLGPDRGFYAQGANDRELLAMCEDALRDGALACVVAAVDRKSVVLGKSVSVRVDLGGRGIIKKKNRNIRCWK